MKKAYLERLGELDPLQPGVTALRNLELPRVPALVWIIPPAEDNVAAPPRPNAPPLEVRGELFDDVAQGDGFLLRGAQGSDLLVMLMFIDEATAPRLSVLAKDAQQLLLCARQRGRDERRQDLLRAEPLRVPVPVALKARHRILMCCTALRPSAESA